LQVEFAIGSLCHQVEGRGNATRQIQEEVVFAGLNIFLNFASYIIMYKAKENGKSEKQKPIADRDEG